MGEQLSRLLQEIKDILFTALKSVADDLIALAKKLGQAVVDGLVFLLSRKFKTA